MITSRKDLKRYLLEDWKANCGGFNFFLYIKMFILRSPKLASYNFLKNLRYYEYYHNTSTFKRPITKLLKLYYSIMYNRVQRKYRIEIPVNCLGYGCRIHHINAGGIVFSKCNVGNYLDIRQFTTIGVKSNDVLEVPTIGNNVFIGCNVCIIGGVHIGDNVSIGAGSVVVKDIPANSIAGGNPCKVIKLL